MEARGVCFVPEHSNSIALIESRFDLSENEKKRSWYSKSEIKTMKKRSMKDAQRLECDKKPSCCRSLEGFTTKGRGATSVAVSACIDAVMDEQDMQLQTDCDNHHRLATVSQEVSKRCINKAIERGLHDEYEARKIHMQDQQKLRPPTLPLRKESKDHLSPFFEQSSANEMEEQQNATWSSALIQDEQRRSKQNPNVVLETHSGMTDRKDICHPGVMLRSPVRAKAA